MTYLDRARAVQHAKSLLFVPADHPARFDKAVASGADLVVLDLEDAVAADQKDTARASAVSWLSNGGCACVRINTPSELLGAQDLEALAGAPGLIAVMCPKAESPESLTAVSERTRVPVIALIESALGVVRAQDIAAVPGVHRLAFGHLDFALDLGADSGWDAMLHARSSLVLASRAAALPGPVDGVTTALDDAVVLTDDLRRAKALGLTAKLLIHPRQVPVTHDTFRPDEKTLRWARRVVESAGGGNAARVDGHMVDAPVLARAHAILRYTD
ncbi:CoA ester lyase [Streptomyces sp. NBC_00117]|uniref:CoA ester lyase n=1 Tax=Streptomyces sp. NBC_00119 TaxID=2975659 RepID=A0AAU1U3I9_9ACTN|nr:MULTISPECIES: CoA ester lyase [unclassified Streptomyces]MCX5435632.1 CoA ester lyase [Streptomyces sp. NBC_00063]WSE08836.1 CoA ester lyase [Streptomyces sp. NBC_01445]